MDNQGYLRGAAIMYTVSISEDAEVSLHVNRWFMNGKRNVTVGFTGKAKNHRGACPLNLTCDKSDAVRHLRTWRNAGMPIEKYVIRRGEAKHA